ncbi:metallophosphoesterase [Rhodococcus sp. BP-252]|uniref:metallophosphoesterase n=1 Tax=unclassified Rhodococcus (in: high G+C Gram-positive bacteria) TaxID=192944 RepID=UPI001C9BACD2|nr:MULTISPECIES: metallophosphoesterase [unclassified Rhodococcus (in: high G+C Gram-positive bacteria)]MBY6410155.1 metallophosphoesterase [Rhodococcus sp. BP-320]MBY6415124.1 metallophosphoesterase [Rhodococcus sp. BP-321]MBY6421447.1 metallophosphoesterase [Rhodococcus sp. BP-324]MBY6425568.1 metallophosphoesterase [Rhodococcus sp. BP-323]MBY6430020.1 metallophosphoesterase [Rhodococcus sp. BP-322]
MTRLLVFGTFLALVALVLHLRYVRATRLPRPYSLVVDVVLVVMWALALIGIGSGELFDPAWARIPAFVGLSWLAVVLYLVLGTLLVGLATFAIRIAAAARGRDSVATRRRVTRVGSAVVAAASVAAVGYGLVEAAHPRITDTTIALDRLPDEFAGLRIALVSDVHAGPSRGRDFVQKIVDDVNAQAPDVVVLDGDLIDGTVELVGSDLEPLRQLSAPLGVFGVSGNHEFYADDGGKWLDLWSSLGVTVLRNERATVSRGGQDIDIVGINDATAPAPYEPDLAAALEGRDPERFSLLLAHQPLQAEEASEMGVDMQVSGHTHAGQIWPLRYLVPLQQPSVEGLDRVGNTTLYTTRGAGAWGPPVRVAAPPEIAMLRLVSS